MTETPNHGYNRPNKGAIDWHLDLNENFENIDDDIEIRGTEANKGDYEPKQGAKYEATDSGAVYYGNGNTWVLADRKVNSVEAESVSTGEFLKAGQSATAIVAPSVNSAYNSIQAAIDSGSKDIAVAESVTENNIKIKQWGTRIYGVGDGYTQDIVDPQTGDPVFYIDKRQKRICLSNLRIRGGSGSGPAIDTRAPGVIGAAVWVIRDCVVSGGPIIMLGPRNKLIEVKVNNENDTAFNCGFINYSTKASLIMNGATCGIWGGSYSNKNDGDEAVVMSGAAGTITGGVTISNAKGGKDGTKRDLTLVGAARMFIGPCSFESGKEYNMQWGLAPGRPGLKNTVIAASGTNPVENGFAKIRAEGGSSSNVTIFNPESDLKFEMDTSSNPNVNATVHSRHKVESSGNREMFINHIKPNDRGVHRIGGNRDSPSTQFALQIQTSPPKFPQEGAMVIADGTNWDPLGINNAALVMYNGSSWIEVANLEDTL